VIVLLNGAFGIGKTMVARALVARLPDSFLFDPEKIGRVLQQGGRLAGRGIGDFQDLRSWRRLTVLALRTARAFRSDIVVPMTFSNASYLQEIRQGISRFEPQVFHFCLVAPVEVVHARLRERGSDLNRPDGAWQFRRATECCAVHGQPMFAEQISAVGRGPEEIAQELVGHIARLTNN
jgi:hypothetical protein